MVKLKRAYEPPSRGDGYRVLVERLWPRGIRKQNLEIDGWMKEVAPSHELRKWFAHDPERWPEFKRRYLEELKEPPAADCLRELAHRAAAGTVTLIFSSHEEQYNNAVVIRDRLQRMVGRSRQRRPRARPSARRRKVRGPIASRKWPAKPLFRR
jgi:uncharacterized protein YeaO (DUF488 family)